MQFLKQKKKTPCIEHAGEVVNITPTQIEVSIINLSACSACHAKSICSTFDQKEKNISVINTGQNVNIGDNVNVILKQSLGVRAVVLAYLLPVFFVMIVLLALTSLGIPELIAGISSLIMLMIYYVILYFFQDKLKKVYNFQIVKKE